MSTWIPLTAIDQLADGSYERFEFDQVDVLVFREGIPVIHRQESQNRGTGEDQPEEAAVF